MDLLKLISNKPQDKRKCQATSDSDYMNRITQALTAYSTPVNTPELSTSQAAPVQGNVNASDDYDRMTKFVEGLKEAAQSRGSKTHLGSRELEDLAHKYAITDKNFINLAGRMHNASGARQDLYLGTLATQYFNPAMQKRQQAQQTQRDEDAKLKQDQRNKAAQIWANQEKAEALSQFNDITDVKSFQKWYNARMLEKKVPNFISIAEDGNFGKDTQEAYTKVFDSLKNPFERRAFQDKIKNLNATAWSDSKNKNNSHNLSSIDYGAEITNDKFNEFANGDNGFTWDDAKIKSVLDSQKNNVSIVYKQGGSLRMKVNYFQAGGAVAQQAAQPAAKGQDIQTKVIQLVQAAMQGDGKATQAVQQIMQAAEQGDEQAAQIAQLIQAVIQQMQGQAQAAKRGAKLSYIHSLKTGCPEGYEVSYNKKGGHLCKECVKKHANGDGKRVEASKLTPKSACGSKLKKRLCTGKKLAEGDKLATKKNQKPTGFLAERKDLTNAQKLQQFNRKYPNESSSVDLTPAQRKTEDSLYVKAKKDGSLERLRKQHKQ